MSRLSIKGLQGIVASYVDATKISVNSFSAAYETITQMVETIGKIHTLESKYEDKLAMLNGEFLSDGKIVEEWKNDLILPSAYDSTGAGAMSPSYLTFRKPSFSYTLGRKKIKVTIPNNQFERVVHNEVQLTEIVAAHAKALNDSQIVYEYNLKRQLLGVVADLAYDVSKGDAGVVSSFATSTAYAVGEYVKSSSNVAVVMETIPASNTDNFATLLSAGKIVKVNELAEEIAKPVDTSTGEAFIEAVKKDVEIASDISEGHSFNGNTLGATQEDGLVLFVKQGIMPSLETKTMAGAFHLDKVAIPTEVVTLPDLGSADSKIYAILMDRRGAKDFPTYRVTRENLNGDGDFMNYFRHLEDTCHFSRNCFVKVYHTA